MTGDNALEVEALVKHFPFRGGVPKRLSVVNSTQLGSPLRLSILSVSSSVASWFNWMVNPVPRFNEALNPPGTGTGSRLTSMVSTPLSRNRHSLTTLKLTVALPLNPAGGV